MWHDPRASLCIREGRRVLDLRGHDGAVTALAFDRRVDHSHILVSTSEDGTFKVRMCMGASTGLL
jgi:WD40 repeat protein